MREAVLAQFPSLQIGVTRASDTVGDRSDVGNTVHTLGIGATLNLPLFDRNQGNIAIQRSNARATPRRISGANRPDHQ